MVSQLFFVPHVFPVPSALSLQSRASSPSSRSPYPISAVICHLSSRLLSLCLFLLIRQYDIGIHPLYKFVSLLLSFPFYVECLTAAICLSLFIPMQLSAHDSFLGASRFSCPLVSSPPVSLFEYLPRSLSLSPSLIVSLLCSLLVLHSYQSFLCLLHSASLCLFVLSVTRLSSSTVLRARVTMPLRTRVHMCRTHIAS